MTSRSLLAPMSASTNYEFADGRGTPKGHNDRSQRVACLGTVSREASMIADHAGGRMLQRHDLPAADSRNGIIVATAIDCLDRDHCSDRPGLFLARTARTG